MEYLFLALGLFVGWWVFCYLVFWYLIIKKVLPGTEEITHEQRIEFLKTRRQRNLK